MRRRAISGASFLLVWIRSRKLATPMPACVLSGPKVLVDRRARQGESPVRSIIPEAQLGHLDVDFFLVSTKKLRGFLQARPLAHENFQVEQIRRRPGPAAVVESCHGLLSLHQESVSKHTPGSSNGHLRAGYHQAFLDTSCQWIGVALI